MVKSSEDSDSVPTAHTKNSQPPGTPVGVGRGGWMPPLSSGSAPPCANPHTYTQRLKIKSFKKQFEVNFQNRQADKTL